MKRLIRVYVRYAISGLAPTIFELLGIYFLVEAVGISYLPASAIVHTICFIVSFVLRKFWVFKNNENCILTNQLLWYLLLFMSSMFINLAVMYFLVEGAGFGYVLAQVVSGIFLGLTGFFLGTIIFKRKEN